MGLVSAETFRDIVSGRRQGFFPAALRGLLAAAEPIYGAVVARKNRRYDNGSLPATRVEVPVISVGNLTVGGTGKTPFVIWLAKWFRERGVQVALISRGYGQKQGLNDEAREIAAQLPAVPQWLNPDRVAAARQAIRQHQAEVLLLDDAFQHRRIARDLDIVLIDALEPFGFGHLLPRGLLREPVESLKRAHVVALSRADAVSVERREELRTIVARLSPQAIWLELIHQPVALIDHTGRSEPLHDWQDKPLAAFAGIGNPAGFEHTLRQCSLQIAAFRPLADHQAYSPATLTLLEQWLQTQSVAGAVCTHKDLVKIPHATLGEVPLRALQIALAIQRGEKELAALLTEVLNQRTQA
jgi:tetraacyldisaccharide 4'-kinase